MKRACRHMLETVSHQGGFLWAYQADFGRCWGELEARRSMLWVQPPGTPAVGHVLLDAFHATKDDFYHQAALYVARALIAAQHPSGGWNYVHDFAGPESLGEWYGTVGRNAWRLEEFHQQADNSTFDDATTSSAGSLLLRLGLEGGDAAGAADCRAAFERVLGLLARSQYPNGGWPQRYPLRDDYTRHVTFNDNVIGKNIELLLMASKALGDATLAERARAAMDNMLALQQPAPQPAWGLQHGPDGSPAAARSFEPRALVTHTTATNLDQLMNFCELTGDVKYLARVGEGIDWLERVRLPEQAARDLEGSHPTFVELGSDEPLYVHRRGSNVVNGAYFHDKRSRPRLSHYLPARVIDTARLRRRHEALVATAPDHLARRAPLGLRAVMKQTSRPAWQRLPAYFSSNGVTPLHVFGLRPQAARRASAASASGILSNLNSAGVWLSPLEYVSNPYRGAGAAAAFSAETYASKHVGDRSDTSPYRPSEAPDDYPREPAPLGISVRVFIENMTQLTSVVQR